MRVLSNLLAETFLRPAGEKPSAPVTIIGNHIGSGEAS